MRRTSGWRGLAHEIAAACDSVRLDGWCWASCQPQVVALATPVVVTGHPIYVLNMSVSGDTTPSDVVERLRAPLLDLGSRIRDSMDAT